MNLADIRKKAQKERDGAPHAASARQVGVWSGEHPKEPAESTIDPLAGLGNSGPRLSIQPAAEQILPAFDPLAVLLAGRELAGCNGDLPDSSPTPEPVGEEFKEFLCFRVSSEKYAINIMDIKEIIKPRELTEVPRVPEFVSGVISLRGIIIWVFNLRKRLELLPVGMSGKERIVVVKKGEEFCGVLVDEVIQVARIAASTIEQPPSVLDGIDRDFVDGIGRFPGGMLILLNLENILDLALR
ncbi:MAG: purine-binding chemotaxis protein [Geobacteraceae bacterium]|nr:MAG: purine-binding chemotaxis protein [Geobacteraceae bacterium]